MWEGNTAYLPATKSSPMKNGGNSDLPLPPVNSILKPRTLSTFLEIHDSNVLSFATALPPCELEVASSKNARISASGNLLISPGDSPAG